MPRTAIESADDVEFAIVPLVSTLGIEDQIHVRIFRVAELLGVAVPVAYADEEFFDMISRRIHAQVAVVDVKLQNPVVNIRPYLWSYIHTVVSGAVLFCHHLSALRCRRVRDKKDERQSTDHNCE